MNFSLSQCAYHKSKAVPRHHADGNGERRYIAPHSRSRHYMGANGQRHALAALYPPEGPPDTHCAGGWVGIRACLGTEARGKKLFASAENRTLVKSVVRHYTDMYHMLLEQHLLWFICLILFYEAPHYALFSILTILLLRNT
jgi:hypothetical protein